MSAQELGRSVSTERDEFLEKLCESACWPDIGWTRQVLRDAYAEGQRQGREEAATAALEQRCERDTPWDLAIQAVVRAIRAPSTEAPSGDKTK